MIDRDSMEILARQLERDEGVRRTAYRDSKGILSIGIGHNLEAKPLSARAIRTIFEDDLADAIADLNRSTPWWTKLDPVRQRALLNMCFQLGIVRLLNFSAMLAALATGDWTGAARECLDSQYARVDAPARAHRIATMFETGKDA